MAIHWSTIPYIGMSLSIQTQLPGLKAFQNLLFYYITYEKGNKLIHFVLTNLGTLCWGCDVRMEMLNALIFFLFCF